MKTIDKNDITKITNILKPILWDYNIDAYRFYLIISGEISAIGHFDFNKAFIRALERLYWYDLIKLFGLDFIKEKLTPEIINGIRNIDLRNNYDFVRKILHSEPLPVSEWNSSYRKTIGRTVLSQRWNRIKQSLLQHGGDEII